MVTKFLMFCINSRKEALSSFADSYCNGGVV
jgi:hypothetical protein